MIRLCALLLLAVSCSSQDVKVAKLDSFMVARAKRVWGDLKRIETARTLAEKEWCEVKRDTKRTYLKGAGSISFSSDFTIAIAGTSETVTVGSGTALAIDECGWIASASRTRIIR